MKRNAFGDRPCSSGRIEHEPISWSNPNWPQTPNHVAINAPNPQIQVKATIKPRYSFRYNLQQKKTVLIVEERNFLCSGIQHQ